MPNNSALPNLLLLQIRDNERVRQEELTSFARHAGIPETQFSVFNVFDQPEFAPTIADGHDALLVGGASEASVLEPETYPFVPPAIELLRHCINTGKPVFASCYGFQLAVLALGGEIIRDREQYEMGTIPLHLTPAAQSDPIFHDTPNPFMAVSVHQEYSRQAPPNSIELAYTDHCCHAFRVNNKPFWACQFHPEVDKNTLIERLTVFKEQYTDGDDHLNSVLDNAVETPESNHLLQKFVNHVLTHC